MTDAQPDELKEALQASLRRYWRSNLRLMGVLLVIWALASLGCGVLWADVLNEYSLPDTGYPLGFWFAQQGSILVGIGFTAFYIVACVFRGMEPWSFGITEVGVDPQGVGFIGMLLNFAVTLGLTPFFPPPSERVKAMVDAAREPEGISPALDMEDAPEH